MKKNEMHFAVWFAVVAVAVFAAAVVLKGRLAMAPGSGAGKGTESVNSDGGGAPVPDSVAVSPTDVDGDEIVSNATAGYYFSMPSNWYVEKSAGAGLAIYPDYDPHSGGAPECKIEISAFKMASSSTAGAQANVNAWITNYLHADPTADVTEISRAPVELGGASGSASSSAVEWHGTLNNVTTTLVFAVGPENILEIAPSTLSEAGDADNGDCDLVLQALVANLQFGAYEP